MRIEVADRITESGRSAIGVVRLELRNAADAWKLSDRYLRLFIWLDESFLEANVI
jgi:hypothetical protein